MTLTQKTDHVAEGQGQLITQFRGKANFEALLGTWLAQIQEIEDVLFDLLSIPGDINSQEGAQLDLLGKIVGQPRQGRSDAEYLPWIKARLAANLSSGLPDELLTVLSLVVSNEREYEEFYPAAFTLRLIDAFTGDAGQVAALLTTVRAGGVNSSLEYSTVDASETFRFASGDTAELDYGIGWALNSVVNGRFTKWVADDPCEWSVYETLPNAEISEVGSGESHGGTGEGACNLYYASGTAPALWQTVPVVPGIQNTLTITVSAISGALTVADSGGDFNETYSTIGTHVYTWTPDGSTITLRLGVGGVADVTVDEIQIEAAGGLWAAAEEI